MKKKIYKLLSIFLACVLVMTVFSACGDSQSASADVSDNTTSHSESVQDNSEGAKTESDDLTTESEGLETKNVFGDWFIEEYKDEFGDGTGSTFCFTICEGSFSNTATSGSDLTAGIYFDASHHAFLIRLLEYGNTNAAYSSNSDISIKCKVGEYVFEDTPVGDAPNGELILSESNKSYKKFYDYLEKGEEIRIVIYIDNSKYNFSISGYGFRSAIAEQERRGDSAGISGTYKNVNGPDEYRDWFIIKQSTPTSGTITAASDSGSAMLNYEYDPSTYVLTVTPNSDWTYRCLYDRFIVYGITLVPDDGTREGNIPDSQYFDATAKWSSSENKATTIYEFKKDGSFISYGTDYKGEDKETESGSYTRVDDYIILQYDGKSYTWACFIFDGKLYDWSPGVYVIDK